MGGLMGCLVGLFSIILAPLKWSIILVIKFFKMIFYGIAAIIGIILHLLGFNLAPDKPYIPKYTFKGVQEELNRVDQLDGFEFERYVANLLKKLGYYDVQVSQASNDYGVDVTATKDNIKYAFQCKRYNSSVGNEAVQEVVAGCGYYGCSKAVVVTNNYFTNNAKELAICNNVELWDRYKLSQLIQEAITIEEKSKKVNSIETEIIYSKEELDSNPDTYIVDAIRLVADRETASISLLQSQLNIGYGQAAKIIDEMEARQLISGFDNKTPRKVFITTDELGNIVNNQSNAGQDAKPKRNWINYLVGTILSLLLWFIIFIIIVANVDSAAWGSITNVLSIFLSFKLGFLLTDKTIEKQKCNKDKHYTNI